MKNNRSVKALLTSFAVTLLMPEATLAQQISKAEPHVTNIQATKNMRSRIAAAIDRVVVTEQHGKISPARSVAVRRQLAKAQNEITQFSRQRGFVTAAQLAYYDRMIVGVDAELGEGVIKPPHGNDALPSPEVLAFQRIHARLRYNDARIEFDDRGCAIYRGKSRSGRLQRELLRDASGRKICPRP